MPKFTTIPGRLLADEIITVVNAMTWGQIKKPIDVKFSGDSARTDGHSYIALPNLAPAQLYDIQAARILRGYANHETDHVLFSETAALPDFVSTRISRAIAAADKARRPLNSPAQRAELGVSESDFTRFKLWKDIENAAEDWRIEKEGKAPFPGSFINISATRDHVVSREARLMANGQLSGRNPAEMIGTIITWRGAIETGYPCAALARNNIDAARAEYADAIKAVDDAWSALEACRNHREIMAAALKIADAALEAMVAPPSPRPDRPSQQTGTPKRGQNPGSTGRPSSAQGSSPGQGPALEPTSGPDPGPSGQAAHSDNSQADNPSPETSDAAGDPADMPASQIQKPKRAGADAPDPDPSSADPRRGPSSPPSFSPPSATPKLDPDSIPDDTLDISDILDVIAKATRAAGASAGQSGPTKIVRSNQTDLPGYLSMLASAGLAASGAGRALRTLLMSRSRRFIRRGLEDGDLDTSAITSLATGDPDIYERRSEIRAERAAVFLLLDHSISMRSPVAETTPPSASPRPFHAPPATVPSPPVPPSSPSTPTTPQEIETKTRIQVLTEAAATLLNAVASRREIATAIATYTTQGHNLFTIVSPFGAPASAAKAALGAILSDTVYGGTPTGQALVETLSLIATRPEPRKIVFLITDGEAADPKLAIEAVRALSSRGVIVCGIGVGPSAPKMPIPGWITLKDISELPTQLITAASAVLAPQ